MRQRAGPAISAPIGHAAQAKVLLRRALEIFQRIGAAEARDLLVEVNAPTDTQPRG
jgi:hypothetical protein